MRLIDADSFKETFNSESMDGKIMQAVIDELPTIDPETLPIVQELRKRVETLSEGVANLSDNLRLAYLQRDELKKTNKDEWKAEWIAMTDDDGCTWFECSRCEYGLDSLDDPSEFCPGCGRPMTQKAWAEFEKRLRGVFI